MPLKLLNGLEDRHFKTSLENFSADQVKRDMKTVTVITVLKPAVVLLESHLALLPN